MSAPFTLFSYLTKHSTGETVYSRAGTKGTDSGSTPETIHEKPWPAWNTEAGARLG